MNYIVTVYIYKGKCVPVLHHAPHHEDISLC